MINRSYHYKSNIKNRNMLKTARDFNYKIKVLLPLIQGEERTIVKMKRLTSSKSADRFGTKNYADQFQKSKILFSNGKLSNKSVCFVIKFQKIYKKAKIGSNEVNKVPKSEFLMRFPILRLKLK